MNQNNCKLLGHRQGVITAIQITFDNNSSNARNYNEIKFKECLKVLDVYKDQKGLLFMKKNTPIHSEDHSFISEVDSYTSAAKNSIYENFNEKLASKYLYKPIIGISEHSNENAANSKKKRKLNANEKNKRDTRGDFFDYDDPFIDDSDLIEEAEQTLKKVSTKTKESGFFVSSGDLDVVKRTPIKAKASTMSNNNQEARLPVITSMGAPEMSIQNNNSKKSTNIANIDAIDTRHVSNIGSSPKLSSKSHHESQSQSQSQSQLTTSVDDKEEINPESPSKIPNPTKRIWKPSAEVLDVIKKFHLKVTEYTTKLQSTGKKLNKKFFPRDLDMDLFEADKSINQLYVGSLNRVSGYHEALGEIFGPWMTVGMIKRSITRVRLMGNALNKKKSYHDLLDELKNEVKLNTVVAEPNDKRIMKIIQKAKEAKEAKADNNVDEPSNDPDTTTTPSNNQYKEPKEPKEPVVVNYKFITNWNPAMRSNLFKATVDCQEWIDLENAYRSQFSSADTTNKSDSEIAQLNKRKVMDDLYQQIISYFPEACLYGDINYLKNAIQNEKFRLKQLSNKSETSAKQIVEAVQKISVGSANKPLSLGAAILEKQLTLKNN